MPVYAYKGVTSVGKSTRGQVTAESMRSARARMRQDGIFLTEIGETSGTAALPPPTEQAAGEEGRFSLGRLRGLSFHLGRRVPALERAIASRQLATLVGAGIPLVEALTALVEQVEHSYFKAILGQVRTRVNEGSSLGDALDETGEFDNLYVSMVRAGEASGALAPVLLRLADYMEEQNRLRGKIVSILIYPAFMLLFTLMVVAALVTVVMPQITSLLGSLDAELPFYTVWVIKASEITRDWWWAMLGGIAAAFALFRTAISTERGRLVWDRTVLRMPIVGRIARVVAIARFSRTLGTLLSGGVGIVQSLDIARYVANNAVMSEVIENARRSILEGSSLAQPLRQSGEFPPLVTTMVEVGERSGEVESMLDKVAATYDEQVEATITRFTALLEPLLIMVMVGIVLFIILATLTPLLRITNALG